MSLLSGCDNEGYQVWKLLLLLDYDEKKYMTGHRTILSSQPIRTSLASDIARTHEHVSVHPILHNNRKRGKNKPNFYLPLKVSILSKNGSATGS